MPLTRRQITRALSAKNGLPFKVSMQVISVIIKAIITALSAGEEVKIRNFGRFTRAISKTPLGNYDVVALNR